MSVKCNITNIALEEIEYIKWGFTCKSNPDLILENYFYFLACENLYIDNCNIEDCNNNPIIITCNIAMTAISKRSPLEVEDCDIIFYVEPGNLIGETSPITYQWVFEEDDFSLVGGSTSEELKLIVKSSKILELLVTRVGLTITDSNGCSVTRYCWFSMNNMYCSESYSACTVPTMLVVNNNYIGCPLPRSLVVS